MAIPFLSDISGKSATFAGNVTLNSRLTFDYGGDHYFEAGTNTLAYKSSGGTSIMLLNASTSAATFAGVINISNRINTTGGGTLLRKTTSSWTGREDQDILYQGWNTNTGDYIYLKAPGNSATDHATAFIGDNVFSFGRSDVETGTPELTSVAAPLSENWLVLNSTSATFGGTIDSGNINISDGTPVLTLTDTSSSATVTHTLDGVNYQIANNGSNGNFKLSRKVGTTERVFLHAHDNGNVYLYGTGTLAQTISGADTTFAGDVTVNGGDVTIAKQNDAPTMTLLHDGTNPTTNDLLFKMQFQSDYGGSHQNWGKIEVDTNASSVRTNMDFYVKSTSGNEELALRLEGQGSAVPNATFAGDVTANGDGSFGTSGATNNSSVKTLDGSIITKIQSQTAGDTAGILGTESNNILRLVTNNTTALTIDTSQNATFAGKITTTALQPSYDTNYYNVDGTISSYSASNYMYVNGIGGASGQGLRLMSEGAATNIIGLENSNNHIFFQTNSSERMRINSSGNVGIGTGADIYGDLHLEGGQQDIVLTNTSADGVAGLTIARIIGQARGYGNNGAAMQSIDFVTNSTAWYKGDIVFKTNNSDGTDPSVAAAERMRITSAGDITVSGGDLFLNSGTSYNDKGVVYLSNERSAIISDIVNATANGDTSLDFQTRKSGTRASALFIDEFRNTKVLGSTLLVNPSDGGNASIEVTRTGGANLFLQSQSSAGVVGCATNNDLDLKTNDATRIRIKNSGNVAIGSQDYAAGGTLDVQMPRNGTTTYTYIGDRGNANGQTNPSLLPINKTSLVGYSIPYPSGLGGSGSRLTTCGFLQFESQAGWTGGQRTWAITSGFDTGGSQGGESGNKLAIICGNAQNVEPQLGNNGDVGSGTVDGANTQVAAYWDNGRHTNLEKDLKMSGGGGIYGKNYTQTSSDSTFSIIDTGLAVQAGVYEVFYMGNPNDGGSSVYKGVTTGLVIVSVDYTDPNVVNEIRFVQTSITGGGSSDINLVVSAKILQGGSEYNELNYSTSGQTIRIKISGWAGSKGAGAECRITRRL